MVSLAYARWKFNSYVGIFPVITQQLLCICLIRAACRYYIIKYQLHMVEQSLNITADASLPRESTIPDLLPGTCAVTAARLLPDAFTCRKQLGMSGRVA